MTENTMTRPRGVVAAIDGSPHDETVVRWAAAQAARTGADLRLVSVVDAGLQLTPYEALVAGAPSLAQQVDADTRRHVADLATGVAADHPGVTIVTDVPWGSPTTGLVQESEGARLLVVGLPRHSLFGSVVGPVVAHAHCPVVVLPDGAHSEPPHRVVVGVDGSEPSLRALDFALAAAEPAGASVTCVAAWRTEVEAGMVVAWPYAEPSTTIEKRFVEIVEGAVERVAPAHPGVTTEVVVRHGPSASVVTEVAAEREADLVVVGSRGHGGFAGLLLGSVSRRVVAHAGRPVAVVH